MAMGRRKDREHTPGMWLTANDLPRTGGHPFYQRLNTILYAHGFDDFRRRGMCSVLGATVGRPSLTPGTYFRLLLIGYFEGIDWSAESPGARRIRALRGFLGLGLEHAPPEHSTISRTRRLIDLETHRAVFTWILQVLAPVRALCRRRPRREVQRLFRQARPAWLRRRPHLHPQSRAALSRPS